MDNVQQNLLSWPPMGQAKAVNLRKLQLLMKQWILLNLEPEKSINLRGFTVCSKQQKRKWLTVYSKGNLVHRHVLYFSLHGAVWTVAKHVLRRILMPHIRPAQSRPLIPICHERFIASIISKFKVYSTRVYFPCTVSYCTCQVQCLSLPYNRVLRCDFWNKWICGTFNKSQDSGGC